MHLFKTIAGVLAIVLAACVGGLIAGGIHEDTAGIYTAGIVGAVAILMALLTKEPIRHAVIIIMAAVIIMMVATSPQITMGMATMMMLLLEIVALAFFGLIAIKESLFKIKIPKNWTE